jgi:CHAT domain-containing protein
VLHRAEEASRATEKIDSQIAVSFQLLEAKAANRLNNPKRALVILQNISSADLSIPNLVTKTVATADALCRQENNKEGISELMKIGPLLPSAGPGSNAEWFFQRARCKKATSDEAINDYKRARKLAREAGDKYLEVSATGNLGYALQLQRHFDESVDIFKEVLQQNKDVGSPLIEELTHGYMAQSHFELGETTKAYLHAERAERLAEALGRSDDQARRTIDVGRSLHEQGDYRSAAEKYLQATDIARRLPENIRSDITVRAFNNLAALEVERGNFSTAEKYCRQAELYQPIGDNYDRWVVNKIDIALGQKNYLEARNTLTQLLADQSRDAKLTWLAQDRRARLAELEDKPAEADFWYAKVANTAIKEAERLKHDESQATFLGNSRNSHLFFSEYINFLIKRGRPIKALQIADIARLHALRTKIPVSLPTQDSREWLNDIQNKLAGKIAMAFWVDGNEINCWFVTSKDFRFVRQIYSQQKLESLILAYRKEIELHTPPEGARAAQMLYALLIGPVKTLIPPNSQVLIVRQGALSEVPFESLVRPSDSGWQHWIDDVEITNAVSLTQLGRLRDRHSPYQLDILAMGAPIQVDRDYPVLRHAKEEIDAIAALFPSNKRQVLTAERATPLAFLKASTERYRVIHFATHGYTNALEPLESAIILSPGPDNRYKLYAADIVDMKWQINAELVTISSCDSVGVRSSELTGPLGLLSAFMQRDVRYVVASLGKVDDAANSLLMKAFYEQLAQGKDPAGALREAKLKLLHSTRYKSAYYWSLMQLYTNQ